MNIIAVANQKGGVGKTTTVVNLGAALARKGKSVLCIDFDPQANLTNYVAGCEPRENSIASVMRAAVLFQPADIRETIYHSERFGFDFIPSDLRLSEADIYLATAMSRETVLRRVLEPVRQAYDYILIDCNPSLGLLLTNVLVASNQVIIPVQTQYFATQGLQPWWTEVLLRSHFSSFWVGLCLLGTVCFFRWFDCFSFCFCIRGGYFNSPLTAPAKYATPVGLICGPALDKPYLSSVRLTPPIPSRQPIPKNVLAMPVLISKVIARA